MYHVVATGPVAGTVGTIPPVWLRGGSFNNNETNARCAARNNWKSQQSERQQRVAGGVGGPFLSQASVPAGNAVRLRLHRRGTERKLDLFLAASSRLPQRKTAGQIQTAPHPAAPTVGAGRSFFRR